MELHLGSISFRESIFSYRKSPTGKPIAYTKSKVISDSIYKNFLSTRKSEYFAGRALCVLAIPFYTLTGLGEYLWTALRTAGLVLGFLVFTVAFQNTENVRKNLILSANDLKDAPVNYFKIFFKLLGGAIFDSNLAVQYNDPDPVRIKV